MRIKLLRSAGGCLELDVCDGPAGEGGSGLRAIVLSRPGAGQSEMPARADLAFGNHNGNVDVCGLTQGRAKDQNACSELRHRAGTRKAGNVNAASSRSR